MNNVTLVGRVTKEPSLQQSKQNQNYTRFTIAIDQYTTRGKVAEFIPCIAFGKTAEFLSKHASKGAYLSVQGALHSTWRKTKDGTDYRETTVYVSRLALLTGWKNTASDTVQNTSPNVATNTSQTVPFVSQNPVQFAPEFSEAFNEANSDVIPYDDLPF